MSRNSLLVVGGGLEQEAAYTTARDLGLDLIGVDVNPEAPSLGLADEEVIASSRRPEQILEILTERSLRETVRGVITLANDVPTTVATLAQMMGLPGIPIELARALEDKLKMKALLNAASVRTPRHIVINTESELRDLILRAREDSGWVLKPASGRGSRGVLQIAKKSNLTDAFKEAASVGLPLILEETIRGDQYSAEAFLIDGVATTVGVSLRNYDRLAEFHPSIIEDGGDIQPDLPREIFENIQFFVQRVADAIGVREGALKCDLILDSEGHLWAIEAAGRLSGGWFASHQIPAATGVDLVRAAILASIGERVSIESLRPSKNSAVSSRFLFAPPGQIIKTSGIEQAEKIEGVVKAGLYRHAGELQPMIKSHSDRTGFVIAEGASTARAIEVIDRAKSIITVEVVR